MEFYLSRGSEFSSNEIELCFYFPVTNSKLKKKKITLRVANPKWENI